MVNGAGATYGIVGSGRMAAHMTRYLDLLGLPYRQWHRRAGGTPTDTLAGTSPILVLVADNAIESVCQALRRLDGAVLVHFSGAVGGQYAFGAHPLCTFGPDLYDLDTYRSIPFVCATDGPPFARLLPGLPNPHYRLPPSARPLYHALAVLAGNFSTVLWMKLFETFERELHLPREAALPYLARIAANLAEHPDRALTGPISRRDRATIDANLRALEGDPFQDVYRAFVRAVDARLLEENP